MFNAIGQVPSAMSWALAGQRCVQESPLGDCVTGLDRGEESESAGRKQVIKPKRNTRRLTMSESKAIWQGVRKPTRYLMCLSSVHMGDTL
jgi:hypothetical protein